MSAASMILAMMSLLRLARELGEARSLIASLRAQPAL